LRGLNNAEEGIGLWRGRTDDRRDRPNVPGTPRTDADPPPLRQLKIAADFGARHVFVLSVRIGPARNEEIPDGSP